MALDAALLEQVTRELRGDEARRNDVYDDATGRKPILAFWHGNQLAPSPGKLTIGEGWNLTANGLPDEILDSLRTIALGHAEAAARRIFPAFDAYTQSRRAAILNLAYNVGEASLLTFRRFIAAVRGEHWNTAAEELLDSAWAHEVQPSRRDRVVKQVREG